MNDLIVPLSSQHVVMLCRRGFVLTIKLRGALKSVSTWVLRKVVHARLNYGMNSLLWFFQVEFM